MVKRYRQQVLCTIHAALLGAGFQVSAQTLPEHTDTHRFETSPALPVLPKQIPHTAPPADTSVPAPLSALPFSPGSDEEAGHMAQQIGHYIRQQQWEPLSLLLAEYESHPRADPFLVLYAQGALYRHQKQYLAAIAAFSELLRAQPTLHHVRLDLALMQMEDKQYAEAIKTFDGLVNTPQVPEQVRQLAKAYQQRLQKLYTLDVDFSANYTRNNNVNQASSERTITIGGWQLTRADESMPKVGHGANYGVRLRRPVPLKNRHSLALDLDYSGVHYWDQRDYSEYSVRFTPAWFYQSHQQWVKVGPLYERNWLGGEHYGNRIGAQAEWGRQLQNQHHLIPYFHYAHKQYVSPNLWRYEGNQYRTGLNWVFRPIPRLRMTLGPSQQWDVLNYKPESSRTFALQASSLYRTDNGLNLQASVHAGQRDFYAPHFLFNITRQDRELSATLGLWYEKFSIFGVSPKLVYQHRRINSNIPALYSRKSHGLMVEMVALTF